MNNIKKIIFTSALIMTSFITASSHDMWIAPESFRINKGGVFNITFPNGHVFPSNDKVYVAKDRMADSVIITPAGNEIRINSWKGSTLQSSRLHEEGTYLLVSGSKGGFFTKTTEGKWESKPKDEVSNAANSLYSQRFTKAVVTAGNGGGSAFSRVIGHDLEIIPLDDPSLLKKGDFMSVKVLLEGKAYETELNVTYDSFSKEKNTFAQKIKTDRKGTARFKLVKDGVWLVRAGSRTPYHNPDKADKQSYTATLTFSIK